MGFGKKLEFPGEWRQVLFQPCDTWARGEHLRICARPRWPEKGHPGDHLRRRECRPITVMRQHWRTTRSLGHHEVGMVILRVEVEDRHPFRVLLTLAGDHRGKVAVR